MITDCRSIVVSTRVLFGLCACSLALLCGCSSLKQPPTAADHWKPEPGFISLYNGKDLTGWRYKTNEVFDGKIESTDGRYTARGEMLVVNPHVEGRPRFGQLYTVREFPKDFILKLEFRASTNADSGIFIRKPQLQCRDYWVAGPYKDLKKYKPQEWNQIEVVVKGNLAHCTCNGEVLPPDPAKPNETEFKLPSTGPIGLEADRNEMDYRHIQIKELP
jgi:hypothetical protein